MGRQRQTSVVTRVGHVELAQPLVHRVAVRAADVQPDARRVPDRSENLPEVGRHGDVDRARVEEVDGARLEVQALGRLLRDLGRIDVAVKEPEPGLVHIVALPDQTREPGRRDDPVGAPEEGPLDPPDPARVDPRWRAPTLRPALRHLDRQVLDDHVEGLAEYGRLEGHGLERPMGQAEERRPVAVSHDRQLRVDEHQLAGRVGQHAAGLAAGPAQPGDRAAGPSTRHARGGPEPAESDVQPPGLLQRAHQPGDEEAGGRGQWHLRRARLEGVDADRPAHRLGSCFPRPISRARAAPIAARSSASSRTRSVQATSATRR